LRRDAEIVIGGCDNYRNLPKTKLLKTNPNPIPNPNPKALNLNLIKTFGLTLNLIP